MSQIPEHAFEQGWAALRKGQYQKAARLLEDAVDAEGGSALAEDASFWRAVAYARAGMNDRATKALVEYLEQYPASARVGEASAMLGWQQFNAGDLDGAELHFQAAKHDKVARVRQSAQKGLAAIQAKRTAQ